MPDELCDVSSKAMEGMPSGVSSEAIGSVRSNVAPATRDSELEWVQDYLTWFLYEFEAVSSKKDGLTSQVDDCAKCLVQAGKPISGLGGEGRRRSRPP